ncbi:SGNH_hydrolase domain containing protein [uncultured Caudovirales phage]|uniref:SGNH_hydrolase domain containing protein n=1 Tax=uncultured Caudovirales phage TaxID=2100421 RepID=A0A6J5L776_9CAUD|nr:SGNH_hydrolase domain containing protein [uncultured Caudovirales phage]
MILVNGDSFTYGEELADRTKSWPNYINSNVVNLAAPGFSNDAIIRTTVNAVEACLLSVEYVIVAWTTPNRIEVNGQHLTPHSHRKYGSICDHVFLDWNEEWAQKKFNTQVLLLDSYLRDRGISYLFVKTFDVPDCVTGNWAPGSVVEWMGDCPKGPGGHPLELGHQRIAEKINEHIRNLGWLP